MMLSESLRDWKRRRLWRIPFKRVPKVQGRKAESLRQKDRAGSMVYFGLSAQVYFRSRWYVYRQLFHFIKG